ncbi:hypothetical protein MTO96_024339 [Rhipicephalus appendiculatus]
MTLTTGPVRKRGPATNCQPSRRSQSAASEPQSQGRGHLDVPGLRGNPHGLCCLEAMALHAEKGNPQPARPEEPWPKAAAQTMLERAGRNTSPTGSSQSPPTT